MANVNEEKDLEPQDDCVSGSSNGYAAIPVSVARGIGESHKKDCVVILAYDAAHDRSHVVTWGRSIENKEAAARIGDKFMATFGVESRKDRHQDYRFVAEGERAQIVDALVKSCRELIEATNPLIEQPDDMHEIRKRAQAAIEAA